MASYTPYNMNITDDEWYNFICGLIAGLKLRNQGNGFHETDQIVEDVPIGEEPSDMGIRILPQKYVSQSETSSQIKIPIYSHDVKTSYGAFDVTLCDGNNTVIEGIEAGANWNGSLTYRRHPEVPSLWYISGRSLNNTNDYDKPIILFYVLVGLNLYGEYEEGKEIGFVQAFSTSEYPGGSGQYTFISELYKYGANGSLNMIVPSSCINSPCWIILKNLNKDGNNVYNNSSSIGNKIRLVTMGLGTKVQSPDSYDVFITSNRSYFEIPVRVLMGKEERSRGVKINHIVLNITFEREAYGYSHGAFCSSEYIDLSLIVNKNGWKWNYDVEYESNCVWHLRLVGDTLNSNYDVYEDTDVLGIGLVGKPCPFTYGFYDYSAILEGIDGSGNSYRNSHGSGYKFIENINNSGGASTLYNPSKAEASKLAVNTPYVTFNGSIYSIEEQDIELKVLGVYRDAEGNEKEVEFKSGPIHVVAGDNKVEANIALDSGVDVETNSGLIVDSQYAVTVKAGSEFNVDAGVGQYKASDEKDSDSEDRVRINDVFEFILEQGSNTYNKDFVEEAEIRDDINVVYEQGSETYNKDVVENVEIRDKFDVVYENGSQTYDEEHTDGVEIRDIDEIVYEKGANEYSSEIVDNININDISETVYERGATTYNKECIEDATINDVVATNKE